MRRPTTRSSRQLPFLAQACRLLFRLHASLPKKVLSVIIPFVPGQPASATPSRVTVAAAELERSAPRQKKILTEVLFQMYWTVSVPKD